MNRVGDQRRAVIGGAESGSLGRHEFLETSKQLKAMSYLLLAIRFFLGTYLSSSRFVVATASRRPPVVRAVPDIAK
jgi:hypothetical protein